MGSWMEVYPWVPKRVQLRLREWRAERPSTSETTKRAVKVSRNTTQYWAWSCQMTVSWNSYTAVGSWQEGVTVTKSTTDWGEVKGYTNGSPSKEELLFGS